MFSEIIKYYKDQMGIMLNAVPANADLTSNYLTMDDGVLIGSIEVTTSATFNGTTSTVTLQGSNDNVTFATVLQDDLTTSMAFTLNAASSTYTWYLKAVLFKYYKIVYAKGDASAGSVSANFIGKK